MGMVIPSSDGSKVSPSDDTIGAMIFIVRGQKVMLDADLADLYGVEVKQLKRQVRRNAPRFPADFMFCLTPAENELLRCQIGTLKKRGTHSKYAPFVFTEHGVAMLSSVLNSPRAIQVNIAIIRVFVKLRRVLGRNTKLAKQLADIESRLAGHDAELGIQAKAIRAILDSIRRLMESPERPKRRIGFGS